MRWLGWRCDKETRRGAGENVDERRDDVVLGGMDAVVVDWWTEIERQRGRVVAVAAAALVVVLRLQGTRYLAGT